MAEIFSSHILQHQFLYPAARAPKASCVSMQCEVAMVYSVSGLPGSFHLATTLHICT